MRVYGHPLAPTTQMVLVCLAEKGHKPDFVMIDLQKGEQTSAAHLLRHPFGLTPVIEDESGTMHESRAIVRYIDRVLPGPALTPATPRAYGRMEQFIGIEQAYFSPQIMLHYYIKLLGRQAAADAVEASRAAAGKALDVVQAALESGPFLAGESFSLAEIAWLPYLAIAFWTDNGDLVTSRPRVNDWWTRISSRPSWLNHRPG